MKTEEKKTEIRLKIPVKGRYRSVIEREIFSYFKNEKDVMTVLEAAKALRCSKNTLYEMINDGRLQVVRIGRCFKVPKASLVDLVMNEKNYFIISQKVPDSLWTSRRSCGICVGADGHTEHKTQKGA